MSGHDFNLKIKVRSGRIVRAMRAAGFHTVAELSRACGVNQHALGWLLNMQRSPWSNVKGEMWTPAATRLAAAVNTMPADLWPEHLRDVNPKRGGAELEISGPELAAIMGHYGTDTAQITEDKMDVDKMLEWATERQATAIRLSFGIGCGVHTLDEIGAEVGGVTRERVRQIIAKGLRQIKTRAEGAAGTCLVKRALRHHPQARP